MDTKMNYANDIATFAGTRDDFIGALKSLGAVVEPKARDYLPGDPLRIALRCSAADWVRVFGPVKILASHIGPQGRRAFEAWQYRCADGFVLCVGCQYERAGEENWVTVRALYLS